MSETTDIPHAPTDTEVILDFDLVPHSVLERIATTHLWVNIQTSGTNPVSSEILEVGLVITDLAGVVLESLNWVVHQDQVSTTDWSNEVIVMHGDSGLLVECLTGGSTKVFVEAEMVDFLQAFYGSQIWQLPTEARPILCGDNVFYPQSFIRMQFPEVANQVSHRVFDVSTLRMLVMKYQPDAVMSIPKYKGLHRSMSDISDNIVEFQFILELLGLEENLPQPPMKNPL